MSIVLNPEVTQQLEKLAKEEKRTPSEIVADALQLYQTQQKKTSGVAFLLSIAGQGKSDQDDVSSRDEEILASEVDPVRGWRVDKS
jgi:predicted transcriptional regulator